MGDLAFGLMQSGSFGSFLGSILVVRGHCFMHSSLGRQGVPVGIGGDCIPQGSGLQGGVLHRTGGDFTGSGSDTFLQGDRLHLVSLGFGFGFSIVGYCTPH